MRGNGTGVRCVKSVEEREGRGMARVRHFAGEFGAAVLEGESSLDVQEGGCQALGAEGHGMWGWPESSLWHGNQCGTQKEEGTATRRQGKPKEGWQEAEEMGSSSWVPEGSRYTSGHTRTWCPPGSRKEPKSPQLQDSLPRDLQGQRGP